jgi:hypothetical protein
MEFIPNPHLIMPNIAIPQLSWTFQAPMFWKHHDVLLMKGVWGQEWWLQPMKSVHLWKPANSVRVWWGNYEWSCLFLNFNWNLGCIEGMHLFARNGHQSVTLKSSENWMYMNIQTQIHMFVVRGRISNYSQKWSLEGSDEGATEMLYTSAAAALQPWTCIRIKT